LPRIWGSTGRGWAPSLSSRSRPRCAAPEAALMAAVQQPGQRGAWADYKLWLPPTPATSALCRPTPPISPAVRAPITPMLLRALTQHNFSQHTHTQYVHSQTISLCRYENTHLHAHTCIHMHTLAHTHACSRYVTSAGQEAR
jgi:hypothetical protein